MLNQIPIHHKRGGNRHGKRAVCMSPGLDSSPQPILLEPQLLRDDRGGLSAQEPVLSSYRFKCLIELPTHFDCVLFHGFHLSFFAHFPVRHLDATSHEWLSLKTVKPQFLSSPPNPWHRGRVGDYDYDYEGRGDGKDGSEAI